jgi:hypothetical protein
MLLPAALTAIVEEVGTGVIAPSVAQVPSGVSKKTCPLLLACPETACVQKSIFPLDRLTAIKPIVPSVVILNAGVAV